MVGGEAPPVYLHGVLDILANTFAPKTGVALLIQFTDNRKIYKIHTSLSCLELARLISDTEKRVEGFEGRKEGNVLFNGALNIFYYRSYGVGRIVVKDYSDSEIGNLLPPLNMRLFLIIGVWGVGGGWEW